MKCLEKMGETAVFLPLFLNFDVIFIFSLLNSFALSKRRFEYQTYLFCPERSASHQEAKFDLFFDYPTSPSTITTTTAAVYRSFRYKCIETIYKMTQKMFTAFIEWIVSLLYVQYLSHFSNTLSSVPQKKRKKSNGKYSFPHFDNLSMGRKRI